MKNSNLFLLFIYVVQNCRDNTEGDHCERCANGFSGDATRGTQYDCSTDDSQGQISICPVEIYIKFVHINRVKNSF